MYVIVITPPIEPMLAKLVDELSTLGAAAIAFDIVFPEPDRLSPSRVAGDPDLVAGLSPAARQEITASFPDNDEVFAAAIKGRPVTICYGVKDAVSVTLSPKLRDIEPSDRSCFSAAFDTTTTLTLTAKNSAGIVDTEKLTITVQ